MLRFDSQTPLPPEALVRTARERPGAAILPDGLRWPLAGEDPLGALDGLLDRLRTSL